MGPSTLDDLDTFSTLLESVYQWATDPDQWRVFLEGLTRVLNAKSGVFRVIDERNTAIRTNVHCNLDPDLQEAYRQYYVAATSSLRHCVTSRRSSSRREIASTASSSCCRPGVV